MEETGLLLQSPEMMPKMIPKNFCPEVLELMPYLVLVDAAQLESVTFELPIQKGFTSFL